MSAWTIHATASSGLESVVKQECEELGFKDCHIEEGHVLFQGGAREIALANIALAVADRVEIELGRFVADSYEALYEGAYAINWDEILPENARFPVQAKCIKSQLYSTPDVQAVSKKAIVEKMKGRYKLDYFPEDGPCFPIEMRLRKDECLVLLDTSGEGLFKRGYRIHQGKAPLKETLAAGLLKLSYWTEDRPLFDPFCGSGTLLIEGARMARGIDPGLDRSFLAMGWDWIGRDVFRRVRRERMTGVNFDKKLDILGFDIDQEMISIALADANEVGVKEDITFVAKDMREARLKENFGVIITNPPYGRRLEEVESAEKTLQDFAERFSLLRTWSTYVISPSKNLEKYMGREADRRRKLFNGGIATTYYQFYGPNPNKFRSL